MHIFQIQSFRGYLSVNYPGGGFYQIITQTRPPTENLLPLSALQEIEPDLKRLGSEVVTCSWPRHSPNFCYF